MLLSGWQENRQMIIISLSTHHHKARKIIQNSLSFQLAIWVIIITDWLHKKQTFGSKTKKNHNNKVWFALYTCNPKCFKSHSFEKMWKKKNFFFYVSIISLLFLKKCNIYIDSMSFIQMLCDLKPFWFPATFWEVSLH